MSAEELFWSLVEPLYGDPAVSRSTMMGLPCVRFDGRFFASLDRRTGALLVKLSQDRVRELITVGRGEPFAPAGRVFREWVAIPRPDRRRWRALLAEARDTAARAAGPVADSTVAFAGFGTDGLDFLAGLERDNTKRFFDAHRDVYRRDLLEPAKALVVALGDRLRRDVSPNLRAEPRVGGSLFRVANDLRFAKDKAPYKPHLDVAFWEGDAGPRTDPSLILRITPTEIHLGAGVFALTPTALDRYRTALRDRFLAAALDDITDRLLAAGAELSEPTRVRPPTGLDPTGPAGRFAVRDRFHLTRAYPRPAVVTSADLVAWCADRLTPFAPVHHWLVNHTT